VRVAKPADKRPAETLQAAVHQLAVITGDWDAEAILPPPAEAAEALTLMGHILRLSRKVADE
jgi:hypothetical protein